MEQPHPRLTLTTKVAASWKKEHLIASKALGKHDLHKSSINYIAWLHCIWLQTSFKQTRNPQITLNNLQIATALDIIALNLYNGRRLSLCFWRLHFQSCTVKLPCSQLWRLPKSSGVGLVVSVLTKCCTGIAWRVRDGEEWVVCSAVSLPSCLEGSFQALDKDESWLGQFPADDTSCELSITIKYGQL